MQPKMWFNLGGDGNQRNDFPRSCLLAFNLLKPCSCDGLSFIMPYIKSYFMPSPCTSSAHQPERIQVLDSRFAKAHVPTSGSCKTSWYVNRRSGTGKREAVKCFKSNKTLVAKCWHGSKDIIPSSRTQLQLFCMFE